MPCRKDSTALPREPTRGLIEGTPFARLMIWYVTHFPENQLGASLKAETTYIPHLQEPYFPENQLGASLKGRDYRISLLGFQPTSPRTNSGPH